MIHGGIVCMPANKAYRDNFDHVFGKKKRRPLCGNESFFGDKCIRVKGHDGMHHARQSATAQKRSSQR